MSSRSVAAAFIARTAKRAHLSRRAFWAHRVENRFGNEVENHQSDAPLQARQRDAVGQAENHSLHRIEKVEAYAVTAREVFVREENDDVKNDGDENCDENHEKKRRGARNDDFIWPSLSHKTRVLQNVGVRKRGVRKLNRCGTQRMQKGKLILNNCAKFCQCS